MIPNLSIALCSKSCLKNTEPQAIIEKSAFPIVRIGFTGNEITDQNPQTYLDQPKPAIEKKGFSIIFDVSKVGIPTFSHQKIQSNWLR